MANNDVVTGGRARFFLNGNPIAYALGVDVTETFTNEPVRVLDNIRVKEYSTTAYDVQVTCQIYKLTKKDLVTNNLWPGHAPTEEEFKRILYAFSDMTADIYDTKEDTYIGKLIGVTPSNRRISYTSRTLSMSNYTFLAIGFADEGTPSM